jgi:hypothetical protein
VGKPRSGGPWFGNDHRRAQFERNVRSLYPRLRAHADPGGYSGQVHYRLRLNVPFYGPRDVHIQLANLSEPDFAEVYVDDVQPRSPHRYADGRLCMWYPQDPKEERWIPLDGLPALIGLIERHLFREGWWNETDEWPGPEAPHLPKEARQPDGKKVAA